MTKKSPEAVHQGFFFADILEKRSNSNGYRALRYLRQYPCKTNY